MDRVAFSERSWLDRRLYLVTNDSKPKGAHGKDIFGPLCSVWNACCLRFSDIVSYCHAYSSPWKFIIGTHFKIKTNHLKTAEGMMVSVLRVRDKEEFWTCCFFARLPIWVEHCNFWSEHWIDHNQLAELVLYAQLSFVGTFFICNSAVTAWDAIQLQTTFHLITRH